MRLLSFCRVRLTGHAWRRQATLTVALMLAAPLVAAPLMPVPFIDDPMDQAVVQYPDTSAWQYFRTSSYCYATTTGEEGRLLIGYNRTLDQFHVGFWSDERLPQYVAHSFTKVHVITVSKLASGQLGAPINPSEPWPALVLDNSENRQVFNLKVSHADATHMLNGPYVITFVATDDKILQTFVMVRSAAVFRRLLSCTPRS